MINSIVTKYFETHLDTFIEFHPGVNTLVGESDEGKSGIVRQIKWNAKNRPTGDSYRNDKLNPNKKSDKKKRTSVSIDYESSGVIMRERDAGSINHYRINDQEPLRALRTDVPDEVQELTKIKDVNIQGQHPTEQYFLLADKPGQVAKRFNEVAGLTIMDDALKAINSKVRTCNAEINVAKEEIKEKKKELKDTEWIIDAEKLIKKLNKFGTEIVKKHSELLSIQKILEDVDKVNESLVSFKDVEKAKEMLNSLNTRTQDMNRRKESISEVSSLLNNIKNVSLALNECIDTDKVLNALKTLKKRKEKIDTDSKKIHNINNLLHKIAIHEEQCEIADDYYKKTKKVYDNLREKTECPVCGRSGK